MTTSEQDQIDRFIRERGVTRCPAAAVAPTQADVPELDKQAHRARGDDPVGEAWRQKAKKRGWAGYWARKRAQLV